MGAEAERLAGILAEARRTATSLDAATEPWTELDPQLAAEVGEAFLRQIGAAGSSFWKLGAIDEQSQARLGVAGPVFAQLDPARVRTDVVSTTLDRSTLIAPRFEPEIGVARVHDNLMATACVEVADSRFEAWLLPPSGLMADATLQGEMYFGPPQEPVDDVEVTVRFNGEDIGQGSGSWSEAVGRLRLLPDDLPADLVATGSLTRLFDCEPGDWVFDFGALGTIEIAVI